MRMVKKKRLLKRAVGDTMEQENSAAAIAPAEGKLGIMMPGMGAVATTLIAGVEAVRRGMAKPVGSMAPMGTIRLGKRTDDRTPLIRDFRSACRARRSCLHRLGHLRR